VATTNQSAMHTVTVCAKISHKWRNMEK
jgi:hypothetical protein